MSTIDYHCKGVLHTLAHFSEHALPVFGAPFTRVLSRCAAAAFQTTPLNVVPSPIASQFPAKKLIRLVSSCWDQSHLALPGSDTTCSTSPPSDWLELLRVCMREALGWG